MKLLWNLSDKADKLWVRWLHDYYIKGLNVMEFIPKSNCSWIFKSILKNRTYVAQSRVWNGLHSGAKFPTSKMYHEIREEKSKVEWRRFHLCNRARPGAVFLSWMCLHGRIAKRIDFCDLECIQMVCVVFVVKRKLCNICFLSVLFQKEYGKKYLTG